MHGGGPGSTKGGLGLRVSGYRLVVEGLGFRVETQGEKKSRGRGHSSGVGLGMEGWVQERTVINVSETRVYIVYILYVMLQTLYVGFWVSCLGPSSRMLGCQHSIALDGHS